ncbi:hypothetical protein DFQ30_003839 [Apophysomyces sp. BC1015]|nr:hypothetical protein DFQ30_003839 [Apophysomyces sp. BC1015]
MSDIFIRNVTMDPLPSQDSIRYDLAARAYTSSTELHAILLFHIVTAHCIANCMLLKWDGAIEKDKVEHLATFMAGLMNKTILPAQTLNEAIRESCNNPCGIPVVCPATTTACAIFYMARLRQAWLLDLSKYSEYSVGCVIRVFLIAYVVAAKHIHRSILRVVGAKPSIQEIPSSKTTRIDVRSLLVEPPPETKICQRITAEDSAFTKMFEDQQPQLVPSSLLQPDTLCRMELELLHFLDYHLQISPNPLHLWSWLEGCLQRHNWLES